MEQIEKELQDLIKKYEPQGYIYKIYSVPRCLTAQLPELFNKYRDNYQDFAETIADELYSMNISEIENPDEDGWYYKHSNNYTKYNEITKFKILEEIVKIEKIELKNNLFYLRSVTIYPKNMNKKRIQIFCHPVKLKELEQDCEEFIKKWNH